MFDPAATAVASAPVHELPVDSSVQCHVPFVVVSWYASVIVTGRVIDSAVVMVVLSVDNFKTGVAAIASTVSAPLWPPREAVSVYDSSARYVFAATRSRCLQRARRAVNTTVLVPAGSPRLPRTLDETVQVTVSRAAAKE